MKMHVVRSLKKFNGKMAVFARTALMKNHTVCPAQACEMAAGNVSDC